MTSTGGNGPGDGLDALGLESVLWVPGVDYVGGWREARESADRLNRALLAAGLELSEARAVADTAVDGRGVVRLTGWPDAVDRVAGLLELAAQEQGGTTS
ncbi:hypothetical protein QCN29_24700 [Streptomyces sp. HNM0663]|uniref:Uncharacterized protein n=1 Tax=Streptomyces chengmaiensis TaxID=3040919 RepID=A0ABT6HT88_9ACTN|nr:hypothetical protein [Streptomyces chengmaiensis]MDH2391920.1 hypothetical protein [Streptomyces chengmaiensis]